VPSMNSGAPVIDDKGQRVLRVPGTCLIKSDEPRLICGDNFLTS
jgi:hypothetical protein